MTDDRYKQLMCEAGLPNSRSLLQVLQQCAVEAALDERLAQIVEEEEKRENTNNISN